MLDGFEETPQKEATQQECCPKTILMIHDDDEKIKMYESSINAFYNSVLNM